MEAVREPAQVVDRVAHLGRADVELLQRGGLALVQEALREIEPLRDGHEPLLRAVVEVALEAPALVVRDLDEPLARGGNCFRASAFARPSPTSCAKASSRCSVTPGGKRVELRCGDDDRAP